MPRIVNSIHVMILGADTKETKTDAAESWVQLSGTQEDMMPQRRPFSTTGAPESLWKGKTEYHVIIWTR